MSDPSQHSFTTLKRLVLFTPGFVEEERAGFSLPAAKARSAKKAAKRLPPSGIAAPPPKRQCQADLQATMLAHVE